MSEKEVVIGKLQRKSYQQDQKQPLEIPVNLQNITWQQQIHKSQTPSVTLKQASAMQLFTCI